VNEKDFEELRAQEFGRLDAGGHVYLDYTGSGLYAERQLRANDALLAAHVLGNPHSDNPTSARATALVEDARADVLDFVGADPDEYAVVFTSNASSALKLVGEAFPFRSGSRFTLLRDAHNSVLGMRMFAQAKGAEVRYLPLDDELRLDAGVPIPPAGEGPSLFTFPAQSNFSGVKHPLTLVDRARDLGYRVLVDAAAYAPTTGMDLRRVRPDFVTVAFYKMFGYPTGLGALIARREALDELERPWFSGGTVDFVSTHTGVHQFRADAERFEDGTLNFLGIAALPRGLDFLRSVGMGAVEEHVRRLTERLIGMLSDLRYDDGTSAAVLYGPRTTTERGGTVPFNLLDQAGRVLPYELVVTAAAEAGISMRGGSFCNPGAGERALGLGLDEAFGCMPDGPAVDAGDAHQAKPVRVSGALRISVGVPTVSGDLDRLESFLTGFVAARSMESLGTK
jgi:selenocysteine lyase/cysteine desulfurase